MDSLYFIIIWHCYKPLVNGKLNDLPTKFDENANVSSKHSSTFVPANGHMKNYFRCVRRICSF